MMRCGFINRPFKLFAPRIAHERGAFSLCLRADRPQKQAARGSSSARRQAGSAIKAITVRQLLSQKIAFLPLQPETLAA
jgi:hypothetical protein